MRIAVPELRSALSPLSAAVLDEQGFTVVPDVVDPQQLKVLRQLCDSWADDPLASPSGGNRMYTALEERHTPLVELARSAAIVAIVEHLLGGPAEVQGPAFRCPQRGRGAQGLHADLPATSVIGTEAATALVLLDPYLPDNGPTRLIPGSHRWGRAVPRRQAAPAAHHPDEIMLRARAGSALVFNAHLWHSGTTNRSGAPRRIVQLPYRRRRASAGPPDGLFQDPFGVGPIATGVGQNEA